MSGSRKPTINITRRTAIAGAAATTALAFTAPGSAHNPARKPNFLFIMADDMGFADLSIYGRRDFSTPVLDGLARQGMRFTDAYANSAVCTATRVALITGRYQYRLPVGLQEPLGNRGGGMPSEHPTIASLLRDAGYRTSLIGKWHLGALPEYGPMKSGYDEFWGIRQGGVDYFTHKIYGEEDLWDGETQIDEQGYLTELLADKAIETLERWQPEGRPWLMSLHFTAPHWPWEGSEDQAESDYLEEKAKAGGMSIAHFDGGSQKTYAEMVTSLDQQVGRVLAALSRLGLDQDTVVVFTSDNGGERFSDTWPFTGKKTELLEGGLRIPAIVRWPGVTQPNSVSNVPIMSMDWLPTFLAAAGTRDDPAYPTDGVDLMPALLGMPMPERTLFWRFNHKGQEAVRRGDWKYLNIAGNTFLFNVTADPLERANFKDRKPEKFADLAMAFTEWNKQMLYDPNAPSYGYTGKELADHFGMDS